MMEVYDQDPSFWDLPVDEHDADGLMSGIVPTSGIMTHDDDLGNHISWKDTDDDENPTVVSSDDYHLDRSERSGNSSSLGDSSHGTHAAIVSPSSTRGDSVDSDNDDMEEDDRFVASLVAGDESHHLPEFPSLRNQDCVSMSRTVASQQWPISPRTRANKRTFSVPQDSIDSQYQRMMKKLILSMERTEETRTFFKRQRIEEGSGITMSCWENQHIEESRQTLLDTLLQDCGILQSMRK